MLGVKRKKVGGGGACDGGEHQSSFELYLKALPRLDPVDRTVGWVATQISQPQVSLSLKHFATLVVIYTM